MHPCSGVLHRICRSRVNQTRANGAHRTAPLMNSKVCATQTQEERPCDRPPLFRLFLYGFVASTPGPQLPVDTLRRNHDAPVLAAALLVDVRERRTVLTKSLLGEALDSNPALSEIANDRNGTLLR